MTRRIAIFVLLCALAIAAPGRAGAQVFGQHTGGSLVPMNGHVLGGYAELSSNLFGLAGQLRSSFQPGMDFGFLGGIAVYDFGASEVTAVRLGADFKVQVVRRDDAHPVDVTVGAGLGVETADGLNVLRIGPAAVVSRAFGAADDARVRPYAGLQLLFAREEVRGVRESGLSAPLHLGSEFRLAQGLRLDVELQWRLGHEFGDDVAFSSGVTTAF